VSEHDGGRQRSIKENDPSPDVSEMRILLVEDNEVNQQVATELLESAGARVTIANNGGEAVRIRRKAKGPRPSTSYSWTCKCRRWMVTLPLGFFGLSRGFKDCQSLR
jgi:hypothetical protein